MLPREPPPWSRASRVSRQRTDTPLASMFGVSLAYVKQATSRQAAPPIRADPARRDRPYPPNAAVRRGSGQTAPPGHQQQPGPAQQTAESARRCSSRRESGTGPRATWRQARASLREAKQQCRRRDRIPREESFGRSQSRRCLRRPSARQVGRHEWLGRPSLLPSPAITCCPGSGDEQVRPDVQAAPRIRVRASIRGRYAVMTAFVRQR